MTFSSYYTDKMDEFLKSYFPALRDLKKQKLFGDGGHRIYTRIFSCGQTYILMSCGKQDISLKRFVAVHKRLDSLVSVPKLFHIDFDQGLLLLEDLGDQSLEKFFFQKGLNLSKPFYYQALTQLAKFQHQILPCENDPIFDEEFFLRETEQAIYHLHRYACQSFHKKPQFIPKECVRNFKKDIKKAVSHFKPVDYMYCHRDYHSRNLMLKKSQVFLIDFQDAGLGPLCYDLTSLLYDSYVSIDSKNKQELFYVYFEALTPALQKKALSPSHIELMTKFQFLQRGFKACGCFASFYNLKQQKSHLKYIKPTLIHLKNLSLELNYSGIYDYIKAMEESFEGFH